MHEWIDNIACHRHYRIHVLFERDYSFVTHNKSSLVTVSIGSILPSAVNHVSSPSTSTFHTLDHQANLNLLGTAYR
jgi:hypothetical protein